jgi:hypothetical protein
VLASALSAYYIFELLGGHSNQGASGGRFLQFEIRSFPISESLISLFQVLNGWVVAILNGLLLPLNYLLGLGFFLLVGFLQWRRMRAHRDFLGHRELCGFTLAVISILLCTFLRSGVITANDLGIRGLMLAQFVLLIWGAELLNEVPLARRVNSAIDSPDQLGLGRNGRNLLVVMLALGLAGTINDLCVIRLLPILADANAVPMPKWLSPDHKLGSRTYALRQFYEDLINKIPQGAVMQHNPATDPGDLPYGLYADRQLAAETLGCGTVFGGDASSCAQIIHPITDLFEKPRVADPRDINETCTNLSINALIVKDTDPVWADKNSWVWKTKPLLANSYARAYRCGG